jgi:hypothetical protein
LEESVAKVLAKLQELGYLGFPEVKTY